jgi:hypothetical protein
MGEQIKHSEMAASCNKHGEKINAKRILVRKSEGKRLGINGRIIFKCMLKKQDMRVCNISKNTFVKYMYFKLEHRFSNFSRPGAAFTLAY